jgi:putative deaminase of polymorphic toxin system
MDAGGTPSKERIMPLATPCCTQGSSAPLDSARPTETTSTATPGHAFRGLVNAPPGDSLASGPGLSTDLLSIIAGPMSVAIVSLAGAPMTAMAMVVAAPLAMIYLWGRTPADGSATRPRLVVDLLARLLPELSQSDLELLASKVEPFRDDLSLAMVAGNTRDAMRLPGRTAHEAIAHLRVKDWARAARNNHARRPDLESIGRCTPLAAAFIDVLALLYGTSPTVRAGTRPAPFDSGLPHGARVDAYERGVARDRATDTHAQLLTWPSGRYQRELEQRLREPGADRHEPTRRHLPRHERARDRYEHTARKLRAQMLLDVGEAVGDLTHQENIRRTYESHLANARLICDAFTNPALTRQQRGLDHTAAGRSPPAVTAETSSQDRVALGSNVPRGAPAGALTELGVLSEPAKAMSSIFPMADTAAMRPAPARATIPLSAGPVNVALLSGRAYRLQLGQKALEEAIPGWMFAGAAEKKNVRESLRTYKTSLDELLKLEQDIAAIADNMPDYLMSRIWSRFYIDMDPRNATFRSQTWSTRKNWDMAGAQVAPTYYSSEPQRTTIDRSLWEASRENFNSDEALPEFIRGDHSAQHISIFRGPAGARVDGPSIKEWVEFIRREDLGRVAQGELNTLMASAAPLLHQGYVAAFNASLDIAKISGFHAEKAALLHQVLENPHARPVTLSGRRWQIAPLRLLGAQVQAFVFHTSSFDPGRLYDTHVDGGVLYIPNQCLRAFWSPSDLGDVVGEMIYDETSRALLAERVPLDVREPFLRAAKAAADSRDMRDLQISLGKEISGSLWDAMFQSEKEYRKRNLKVLVKPTADVDRTASIEQRMALYNICMGMIGSFSGLPLVGPIFMGPNFAAFANTAMEYVQLRRREGTAATRHLLPHLLEGFLSMVDFDAGDVGTAVGRNGLHGPGTPQLLSYFKVPESAGLSTLPADAGGFIHAGQRTYVRMDSGDVVEVDTSEPSRPRTMARWQGLEIRGPEVVHQGDHWRQRPEGISDLTPLQLFKRMVPEGRTAWSDEHVQGLIDDLALDDGRLRAIWEGQSAPALLVEHMSRYQALVDLDALGDALTDDGSTIPTGMQPVIAQALAARTRRPLEIYVVEEDGATPSLKARHLPPGQQAGDTAPVQLIEKNDGEFFPLTSEPLHQDMANRLSLIDSVIEVVPEFGVNPSLRDANFKPVRRAQVVTEVISYVQQARAMLQQMCLEQIPASSAPPVTPTARQARHLRYFPGITEELLHTITTDPVIGDHAAGPIDVGRAGLIVAEHDALSRRNDVLFRLKHGPHSKDSEALYLNLLVNDPRWPAHVAVEVIPGYIGQDGSLYPSRNQPSRVYGQETSEQRRLQLLVRPDGSYAPFVSGEDNERRVPLFAGHAPDDLGSAILQAMEPADRAAWTSDRARSDVNQWIVSRARALDSRTFNFKMQQDASALDAAALSNIVPAFVSLPGHSARADGMHEVEGKLYIYAYGHPYRLKEDWTQPDQARKRYRIISADSYEAGSSSFLYAGLDHAPVVYRDRHGVWRQDATDRLWTFHKLGAITEGVDVTEALAVLDITGVSIRQLRDIQLGREVPSPDLSDAITRARMRSVIGRLQRDADHFNDLRDPTPLLVLLTKLEGWPRDTSLEVSNEDGEVHVYGHEAATRAVRIGLEDLHPPLLESLRGLFGSAFLATVIGEAKSPSILRTLAERLSKLAATYPSALLDAWYFRWQDADTMLSEELMRQEPGLTKRAAEHILEEGKITRKADMMPNGALSDELRRRATEASRITRVRRLAEAVRTGKVSTADEKAVVIDLLNRLARWSAPLAIDSSGDMTLKLEDQTLRIRRDGDLFQVLDATGRAQPSVLDVYSAISLALPSDRSDRLGLARAGGDALRRAVWEQAERDKDIFRRHAEMMDEARKGSAVLCRVRRAGDPVGCLGNGAPSIPDEAVRARNAVVRFQESLEQFSKTLPQDRRASSSSGSSAVSRGSENSVRSQTLGNTNFASLMVLKPIKVRSSMATVRFPKMEETEAATGVRAMAGRSSGSKTSPNYFIFSSDYDVKKLPKLTGKGDFVSQAKYHREVEVQGRLFKYKTKVKTGGGGLELDRPSDTEAALLEYVSTQINTYLKGLRGARNDDLRGRLVIYTELTPCDSCQYVIKQFADRYPNIHFDVYFSYKNNKERSFTALQDADIHLWTPKT